MQVTITVKETHNGIKYQEDVTLTSEIAISNVCSEAIKAIEKIKNKIITKNGLERI